MIWRINGSSSTNNTRNLQHEAALKARLPIPFGEASREGSRSSLASVCFNVPCHGRGG